MMDLIIHVVKYERLLVKACMLERIDTSLLVDILWLVVNYLFEYFEGQFSNLAVSINLVNYHLCLVDIGIFRLKGLRLKPAITSTLATLILSLIHI